MEIKKIVAFVLIVVLVPLSLWVFSDNTQYKQIGTTHFYLLPDWQGIGSYLHHDGGTSGGFYKITHKGSISDVYWNRQYVIVKCCQIDSDTIEYWYVMKNIKEYDWKMFEIKQFLNGKDYKMALDSLGLSEKQMEHTDGQIPWRIHF